MYAILKKRLKTAIKAAHTKFDLSQSDLARCVVLNQEQQGYQVPWIIHHLIVDGVSCIDGFDLELALGSLSLKNRLI